MYLRAIKEMIDSMVNFEMLKLYGTDPDTTALFESVTHQRFFNVALVDFLSAADQRLLPSGLSYLNALASICAHSHFNVNDSVALLRETTAAFTDWLDQEVDVPIWLPSLDVETTLHLSRSRFIRICGNISKHNFLRLGRVVEDVVRILQTSGFPITPDEAVLVLEDFYERFHTDILNYHGSTICEFLNNIRWGIYEYLQPEYHRSLVRDPHNPPMYSYTYPAGVVRLLAKECYWGLMNEVRSPPYMRHFQVTRWLKLEY